MEENKADDLFRLFTKTDQAAKQKKVGHLDVIVTPAQSPAIGI